jgi:pimeloyl-ACP methyl ester carboxylesterase
MRFLRVVLSIFVAFGLFASQVGCSDSSNNSIRLPQPEVMPVVFVHGQSGSAQQFETQAMRFTSNGYPQNMLFAFEYDTSKDDNPIADLDIFIDAILAQTGANQVYAVGHSRGTSVWTTYLDDPVFSGSGKVAKYVNIDGRSPEELPGGVPTIGIWGEWNTANSGYNRSEDNSNTQIGSDPANNFYFGEKSHTETATSSEAFALMYEFLTGVAPTTTEVTSVSSGTVSVAGRALLFPENLGYAGSTVQVWEVELETGQRLTEDPLTSFAISASGDFGPVELKGGGNYEFALLRPATESYPEDSVHHFYAAPYHHDNFFLRLLSSFPGESISAFIPAADDATGLLGMRQKEFWGDQGASSDQLFINGLNVLTAQISPREANSGSGVNIAVFAFDDESDKITDLDKGELFPFNQLTFLTACDVFIPAIAGGTGSIEVVLVSRGETETRLNIPNRPSSGHRNTMLFRDDI